MATSPYPTTGTTPWQSTLKAFIDAGHGAVVSGYGAVGNGSGDDTAAINSALSSGYKRILVPDGTFKISGTLSVPAGVTLELAPSASIVQGLADTAAVTLGAGAQIRGGTLVGKTTDYVGAVGSFTPVRNGINVPSDDCVIENIQITGFGNAGIYVNGNRARISNVRVTGVNGIGAVTIAPGDAACSGVWGNAGTDMEVDGLFVENVSIGFINATSCQDTSLRHIRLRNITGQHGCYVQNATGLLIEDVYGHDIALNLVKVQIDPAGSADMHGARIADIIGRNIGDNVLICYNAGADLTTTWRYQGLNIANIHGDSANRVLYLGSVRGGMVSNISGHNTTSQMMIVLDCQDTVIDGVNSHGSGKEGVLFTTATGAATNRVTLRGVRLYNPGNANVGGTQIGVNIAGIGGYLGTDGQNITIDGLDVYADNGFMTTGLGVSTNASQETLKVRNATSRGWSSAPFTLASNLRTVGEWSNVDTVGNATNFPYSFPVRTGNSGTKTRWTTNAVPVSGVFQVGDIIENSAVAAAGIPGWVCTTLGGLHNGTWAATTAYAVGNWRRTSTNKILECAVAGTSSGTEPNPSTLGAAVTDGSVTWVYRASAVAVVKAMAAVAA